MSGAVVLREGLVRLDRLPLIGRVPSLPELAPGTRVNVDVRDIDLLDKSFLCTWRETLEPAATADAVEDAQEAV